MELRQDTQTSANQINAYQPGEWLVVNAQRHDQAMIVLPNAIQAWPPTDFDALRPEHFDWLAAQKPECVLLGTGPRQRFPAPALLATLYNANIGVEIMATAAACRTYSLLASDGRGIAAALLL